MFHRGKTRGTKPTVQTKSEIRPCRIELLPTEGNLHRAGMLCYFSRARYAWLKTTLYRLIPKLEKIKAIFKSCYAAKLVVPLVQYENLFDMWLSTSEIGAASLRSVMETNKAEITVRFEQKPYPIWLAGRSNNFCLKNLHALALFNVDVYCIGCFLVVN